jgi:hypothetical protein
MTKSTTLAAISLFLVGSVATCAALLPEGSSNIHIVRAQDDPPATQVAWGIPKYGTDLKVTGRGAYDTHSSPFGVIDCVNKDSKHYHETICNSIEAEPRIGDMRREAIPQGNLVRPGMAEALLKIQNGQYLETAPRALSKDILDCLVSVPEPRVDYGNGRSCHFLALHPNALQLETLLRERVLQELPNAREAYTTWLESRGAVLIGAVNALKALQQDGFVGGQLTEDLRHLEAAEVDAIARLERWLQYSLDSGGSR